MPLPVTVGLVAAYDFVQGGDPGTLYDISGNGHNGTISGGATWTGEGLQFDGVDDYVNVGDLGSLADGYTIIAVAKAEKNAEMVLFSRLYGTSAPTSNTKGFRLWKSPSSNQWLISQYWRDGATPTQSMAYDYGDIADWQMVVGRYDAAASEISLTTGAKSAEDAPTPQTSGLYEQSGSYYIGRLSYSSAHYFDGSIGYLAVYNRSLSDAEIQQVYGYIQGEMADRSVTVNTPRPTGAYIVMALDDGMVEDYTGSYPIAKARGIPITSYITFADVGVYPKQLTWEQIREMRAAGFGIECHNWIHDRATGMTEAELRANLEAVDAACSAAGLPAPEHHAYVQGSTSTEVQAIMADYRDSARGIDNQGADIISEWGQDINWLWVRGYDFYKISADADISDVTARIDQAIDHKNVLILYTHDISEDPGAVGCHVTPYAAILDYIAAKRDAGLVEPVTIDGLYRAMQGIRTYPATGPMTLHGETTGATYDKTVDYVGFVWGTTRHNNPEGTAPDAAGYDSHWIAPAGDYRESKFAHTPKLAVGTYYYRAAAEVDGAWVYGEELTLTVAAPSTLPNLYPAKLGSPYTILTAPYTTGDVLMTIHDADKLETPPNIVCLSGSVAGEFAYTGRYGNTLTGVTALPGTPQATWGVGTFAFRGIAAYDLNALVETVERLKEQIAALQTPGE